ncbi:MAG: hypothetical protein D6698_09755, partial [Gammaproteobacteria bacterium]
MFAGKNMHLFTRGSLTNNNGAEILAMQDMLLAADNNLGKTTSILNQQGHIEAVSGQMSIHAVDLQNLAADPVVQGVYDAATKTLQGGIRVSKSSTTTNCGTNCTDSVTTTVDKMQVVSRSPPATLGAGGNLNIYADAISNRYSSIFAGGNIHLSSRVVDNLPLNIMEVTTTTTSGTRNSKKCQSPFGIGCANVINFPSPQPTVITRTTRILDTLSSSIQAGGNISGAVANLNNANIRSGQQLAASSLATTTDPLAYLNISLPKGQNGLFIVSPDPASHYLIETNPAFTQYENFIGSDYLLNRLHYTPGPNIRRLGDAFFENRLIRESIFAQTGKHFLYSDLADEQAQFQRLMDNAVVAQQALQLVPGIALSADQVAALQQDIVWMVEKTVSGQQVLVPVVYLAGEQTKNSALIMAGGAINLQTDHLYNAGKIQSGNNLALTSTQELVNHGGNIQSGNQLHLNAGGSIDNRSGIIQGGTVQLHADDAILDRRSSEQVAYHVQGTRGDYTSVGRAGQIRSTGLLTLDAGNEIKIEGSAITGGQVALKAKNVTIKASETFSQYERHQPGSDIRHDESHALASLVQGNALQIQAQDNAHIQGSILAADKTLSIVAGSVDIGGIAETQHDYEQTRKHGTFGNTSRTIKNDRSDFVGSSLSAGDMTLQSNRGDIRIIGSNLMASGDMNLQSAENITVQAGYSEVSESSETKRSGWLSDGSIYSTKRDRLAQTNQTAVRSVISADNLNLTAQYDLTLQAAQVEAGHALMADA